MFPILRVTGIYDCDPIDSRPYLKKNLVIAYAVAVMLPLVGSLIVQVTNHKLYAIGMASN